MNNLLLARNVYFSGIAEKYDLGLTAVLVLMAIAFHLNNETKESFPSQAYLSKHLNCSEKSIYTAIKELSDKGLILKARTKLGNVYNFSEKLLAEISTGGSSKIYGSLPKKLPLHDANKIAEQNKKTGGDNIPEIKNGYLHGAHKGNALKHIEQTRLINDKKPSKAEILETVRSQGLSESEIEVLKGIMG